MTDKQTDRHLSTAYTRYAYASRSKNGENEKRAMIKYLLLKDLTPNQISQATIYRWVAEFQRGRQSTEDEHRSGRPADTRSNDNVRSVQDMILKDRRLNIG